MGTSGCKIIKFRGRYWIFSNSYDSYPSGMGNSLVTAIPTDMEEYKKWLTAQRAFYAKWDSLLQEFLCFTPQGLAELEHDENRAGIWQEAFDDRIVSYPPSHNIEGSCMSILGFEYCYTIDLDREVFSVDHAAHFRLCHIPRNEQWIKAMFEDASGRRFVLPQYVPKESLASLALETEDFAVNASTYWESLKIREVVPKRFTSTASNLRWRLFNVFQRSQIESLSATLLSWKVQDLPFREIAFFILCLAAGGKHVSLVDERRVIKPLALDSWHEAEESFASLVAGNNPKGERELISATGVGYRIQGLPSGSAPVDARYWFEGALISLVPRLDRPGMLEKAAADAVQYGRLDCACTSFHALLLSIEHVVLIRSYPDGSVDHTKLLPLFSFESHLSMDAWERYNDIDQFYAKEVARTQQAQSEDANHSSGSNDGGAEVSNQEDRHSPEVKEATVGDRMKADSKEPWKQVEKKGTVGSQPIQLDKARDAVQEQEQEAVEAIQSKGQKRNVDVVPEHEEGSKERRDEGTEDEGSNSAKHPESNEDGDSGDLGWTVKRTFKSLVQLFEATTQMDLKPMDSAGAQLPNEICALILGNVADTDTFNACMKVSRRFRSLCHQRPLIMDNLVFLEPLDSSDTKLKDSENIRQKPDYRVVECSSGRQMDVVARAGGSACSSFTCRMLVGSEKNRRTFPVDCPIAFRGLDVPAPWDEEDERAFSRSCRRREQRERFEPTNTLWDFAFRRRPIDAEASTKELGEFWITAVERVYKDIENADLSRSSEAWTLPPNTTQLSASCNIYYYEEFFHYLFVRIKRTSRFWGTLWEDIIREATESMAAPDESFELRRLDRSGKQVVGADEPLVMLVVGFEVRLFRWEQGFDESVQGEARKVASSSSTLRELQPGRLYLVTDGEDRKVIEAFLMTAVEKLKAAKMKEKPGYPSSGDEDAT